MGNALVTGAVLSALFGTVLATGLVVYYKYYFQTGVAAPGTPGARMRMQVEEDDDDHFVDVAAYNGVDPSSFKQQQEDGEKPARRKPSRAKKAAKPRPITALEVEAPRQPRREQDQEIDLEDPLGDELELQRRREEEFKRQAELARRREKKEAKERKAKAKAEAERKAKAEAERKAKAEAERKAKAEAERKAKAEAERKAKAEAERKAKAKAERRRRAEEEAAEAAAAAAEQEESQQAIEEEERKASARKAKAEAKARKAEARARAEAEAAEAEAAEAALRVPIPVRVGPVPVPVEEGSGEAGADEEDGMVLPTDMRMSLKRFTGALTSFFGKWSKSVGEEEIAIAVESYGDSGEGRAALDRQLSKQYGQGLDEFFVATNRDKEDPARSRPPAAAAAAAAAPREQESEQRQDMPLREALESSNVGECYQLLVDNGVETLQDLRALDGSILEAIFPDSTQQRRLRRLRRRR